MVKKEDVRAELDKQYRKDLNTVLQTEVGRRVFSYLLMDCGLMESLPQGNSKDIFMAGRRAVAIALSFAVDSIDWPKRTSGLELRQLAEREYTTLKLNIHDDLEREEASGRKMTLNAANPK